MTDNEIIRALGECPRHEICENCPFEETGCDLGMLCEEAAELIKRQQAEIEGLVAGQKILNKCVSRVKAEAIKEFAERLKKNIRAKHSALLSNVMAEKIDNLVKKMTGETKTETDFPKDYTYGY